MSQFNPSLFEKDAMQEQLLSRIKSSYDRREGMTGNRYFLPDLELPFFKATATKGKPHIVDIIPFVAGNNFPAYNNTPAGSLAYVLDLWVHKKVGPGKMTAVCPARNYGMPCPICEEEARLQEEEGVDWEDIAFVAKRQCAYNLLVMDDDESEAKGIQIWDVSYAYSEKCISVLGVSPRGGYIAFSSLYRDRGGRSIAFEVGGDKYKKITGHRLIDRDYDIPIEIAQQAYQLDQIIAVYSYEELSTFMWGPGGRQSRGEAAKLSNAAPAAVATVGAAPQNSQSLRSRTGQAGVAANNAPPVEGRRVLRPATGTPTSNPPAPQTNTASSKCPSGLKFGVDIDAYEACQNGCTEYQPCAEASDRNEVANKNAGAGPAKEVNAVDVSTVGAAAPTGGRKPLFRRK